MAHPEELGQASAWRIVLAGIERAAFALRRCNGPGRRLEDKLDPLGRIVGTRRQHFGDRLRELIGDGVARVAWIETAARLDARLDLRHGVAGRLAVAEISLGSRYLAPRSSPWY